MSIIDEQAKDSDEDQFFCKCLGYFTGKTCSVPYENCSGGEQCLNGGTCVDEPLRPCLCPSGYDGQLCELVNPNSVIGGAGQMATTGASSNIPPKEVLFSTGLWSGAAGFLVLLALVAVFRRQHSYKAVHPRAVLEPETEFLPSMFRSDGKVWMNIV
jgi:hypothetical protein